MAGHLKSSVTPNACSKWLHYAVIRRSRTRGAYLKKLTNWPVLPIVYPLVFIHKECSKKCSIRSRKRVTKWIGWTPSSILHWAETVTRSLGRLNFKTRIRATPQESLLKLSFAIFAKSAFQHGKKSEILTKRSTIKVRVAWTSTV